MNDCSGANLTFACRMVCELENAIFQLTLGKASSYSIGSRSYTYLDMNTLLTMRDRFREEDDGSMYTDRKSTRLNSSHIPLSRMPSSA